MGDPRSSEGALDCPREPEPMSHSLRRESIAFQESQQIARETGDQSHGSRYSRGHGGRVDSRPAIIL